MRRWRLSASGSRTGPPYPSHNRGFHALSSVTVSRDTLDEAARALSAHSPDGFVILESPGEWTFSFINDAAALLFGESARIGGRFLDLFPEASRPLVAAALDAAYSGGEPKDVLAPYQLDDAIFEMRVVGISNALAIHFRDISVLALRERQQAAAAALG